MKSARIFETSEWKFHFVIQTYRYFSSLLMVKHAEIKILPPLFLIPSTVLVLTPTVLMLSPCMYWCYPPACTDIIPPRMYWYYPLTVLNNLHSYEAIPPQKWSYPHGTDVIPPMYWATSNILNGLHSTEPTLGKCHFYLEGGLEILKVL